MPPVEAWEKVCIDAEGYAATSTHLSTAQPVTAAKLSTIWIRPMPNGGRPSSGRAAAAPATRT